MAWERWQVGVCYTHTYISTPSIYEEVCFPKNLIERMVRISVDRVDQKNGSRITLKENVKPVLSLFSSPVSDEVLYIVTVSVH